MTPEQQAAMRQAIEELEKLTYLAEYEGWAGFEKAKKTITVLRQALEQQPDDDPVAWMDGYQNIYTLEEKAAGCEDAVIPLYPHPKPKEHWSDCAVHNKPAYPKGKCDCGGYTRHQPAAWVGLTDEEIESLWDHGMYVHCSGITALRAITRAIEQRLKEKNT